MTVACRVCGEPKPVSCTEAQYQRRLAGEGPIQDVMPDVPAAERELLISGICGECFDSMAKWEEE